MILLTHPTGNSNVRAVLEALHAINSLAFFQTTVAINANSRYLQFVPQGIRRELRRRSYIDNYKVATRPLRELVRIISSKLGIEFLVRHEHGWASVDGMYKDMDRYVARHLRYNAENYRLTGVYCYENAAFDTFSTAKQLGLKCFYDLPIAYWQTSRRLLEEEAQRLPEWEPTLMGTRDSQAKLDRKTAEVELADVIICPSKFVYDSLPAMALTKKCAITEFGSPENVPPTPGERHKRLRVLFAGSLSQRKGLADVFAAMKLLQRSDVELVVIGAPLLPMEFYRRHYGDFIYEATRPHWAMLELMSNCDVLVLPSLVEGRALVQQEAMSCGLPLIVTPNAGGEDLIDEGQTGFLVPIRSPHKIAEKIAWFADNRRQIEDMREFVRRKAAHITWHNYQRKIQDAIAIAHDNSE